METMETPKGDTRPPTMPGTRGRRRLTAALLIASLAAAVAVAPAHAADDGKRARADIVREWNEDGSASSGDEVVGRSWLRRSADGLDAMAVVHGLRPGGVYTFWWVVVQDDGDFPADIHVQRAAGTVVKNGGNVRVSMTAQTGDAGIQGFPPLGGALFADLTDPLGSLVRLEIAYHGQAEDAGGDLDVWLSDFWSGTACPPETPNPNPAQPHCPVYFASTHAP